ncbi:autolysin regulatory protein arpU [Fructilactobacillus fructivorans]|uniref:hypothetical protein n=1 Tax=Fructilactobacillus fructivorans TaxID=1614 RepID=UPI000708E1E8|nr:hypothetical protein [Fructilactobacillus fructivorans]KRN40044.1 autolysin regulatory protein arpU [Fructilactobacillus fructivorans]
MQLSFNNYNYDEAKNDAKKVLESYQHYHNEHVKGKLADLSSPKQDGMPSRKGGKNSEAEQYDSYVYAGEFCELVSKVINNMTNENYRDVLTYSYIKPLDSNVEIAGQMLMDVRQMYRIKNEALLCFAEICPMIQLDYANS